MSSPSPAPAQPRWWLLSPLALTLLPLLYSAPALKARPGLRNGLFLTVCGLGLVHGYSLILGSGAQPDLRDEGEGAGAAPLASVRVVAARPPRAAAALESAQPK